MWKYSAHDSQQAEAGTLSRIKDGTLVDLTEGWTWFFWPLLVSGFAKAVLMTTLLLGAVPPRITPVHPQGAGCFSPLTFSPATPPRDKDLVSWHGRLAAGLVFWLPTIFRNWAGECCPPAAGGRGFRCQLLPPLQMALLTPGHPPTNGPLLPSVLHPPRLPHLRARKQGLLLQQC